MSEAGLMICQQCQAVGPPLTVGGNRYLEYELCRCDRCSGLISRVENERGETSGMFEKVTSPTPCPNEVERVGHDPGFQVCGSTSMTPLSFAERKHGLTMPCPKCREGEMHFVSSGIVL